MENKKIGFIGQGWIGQNYADDFERRGFEVVRLDCINELSWPLARYVRVYLIEKRGLPKAFGPVIVLLLKPFVRSRLNANKGVLVAQVRRA